MLGKLKRKKIRTFSNTIYTNKLKWIKLKYKIEYYKTFRGKHGHETDINFSNIFLDPSPRVMKIKTKINKQDLIKIKCFCTAKKIINKMKRQPSEWEKIFANEATDKGLISKIYKQLNIKKQTTQLKKKWAEDLKRHFSKDTQMPKKAHENMGNIVSYQKNVNQKYNEVSPHISQNGHYKMSTKN